MKKNKYFPKLLKWIDDKHGCDQFFLIKNEKELKKTSLEILDTLIQYSWFKPKKPLKEFNTFLKKRAEITSKELKKYMDLDDDIRSQIKLKNLRGYGEYFNEQIRNLKSEWAAQVDYYRTYKEAKQALKEKEGSIAWSIIRNEHNIELTTFDNKQIYGE